MGHGASKFNRSQDHYTFLFAGFEHGVGVYVSHVEPDSQAHRAGLRVSIK